ncbi:MAG: DUF3566 domain-containing protein [Candidatus Zixiibacteriota bacterium]
MKMELKAIGYWPLIKVSFVVNMILGFLMGLFMAMFMGVILSFAGSMSSIYGGMSGMEEELPPFGFLIVLYPIMGAFFGAVVHTIILIIVAFIYNIMAKLVGGMEFEFAEIKPQPAPYSYPPPQPGYPQYQQPAPTRTPPPPPPPIQPLPPDIPPPTDQPDDKEQL